MDLNECKKKGFVRHTTLDINKARSLLEIADIKEETVRSARLNSRNINAFLPLAYDALREALESFCILHGYNVTNHICLGELVRTLVKDFDFNAYDRFRYARNGINYYGRRIDFRQGILLIKNIFLMKQQIERLVKRQL